MASESAVVAGLEPPAFWVHFEARTTIARPSHREEPVIGHVRLWASERGYEFGQDSDRNLVIRVPATVGRGSAPTLILQGHLDMMCERDPASPNDPAEGRIVLLRDGDWLPADGTTRPRRFIAIVAIAALAAILDLVWKRFRSNRDANLGRRPSGDRLMCRWLAYSGSPIRLEELLAQARPLADRPEPPLAARGDDDER